MWNTNIQNLGFLEFEILTSHTSTLDHLLARHDCDAACQPYIRTYVGLQLWCLRKILFMSFGWVMVNL